MLKRKTNQKYNIEKQALMAYLADPDTIQKFFTGFGLGAGGLLGVMGLSKGISALKEGVLGEPKIPTQIFVDLKKDEEDEDKKPGYLKSASAGQYIAIGAGLPMGVFAAKKLLDYLSKSNRTISYAKDLKRLERLYEKKYNIKKRD